MLCKIFKPSLLVIINLAVALAQYLPSQYTGQSSQYSGQNGYYPQQIGQPTSQYAIGSASATSYKPTQYNGLTQQTTSAGTGSPEARTLGLLGGSNIGGLFGSLLGGGSRGGILSTLFGLGGNRYPTPYPFPILSYGNGFFPGSFGGGGFGGYPGYGGFGGYYG